MINHISVFIAGCSYGLLSIFLKLAYGEGFQVNEVVGSQFFLACVILLIFTLLFFRQKVNPKAVLTLMLVGVVNGLTGILYSVALHTIPASLGIVIMFQFTWIGIIIEAIADRKWPNKGKLLAIPFLIVGTFLAGGIIEGGLQFSMLGCVFAFLSAFTYAVFIFCSGRVATHISPLPRSFWITVGGMAFIIFVYPPHFLINGTLGKGLVWYGLALALVAVVIPTLLLAKGAPKVGTGIATILMSSELPMTVIVAAIVLMESVSLLQWAGVIVIIVGICMPNIIMNPKNGTDKTGLNP